ncbi:hypothetical protein FGSG_03798 [Fusarium graminearum PH-1]|uniref:hypothetical protein n=1 Tax=Gibberella zeae (strain ATCC MYA-4620 / CBS 123657 / FGSC 9075 / NRRL 31084 / PH-1) TaxID=229533 RepID=UPI000023D112|nr:hypothetical protein FGSG_03798 [Fusarium graminearum PH-1]ESU09390.1 hypothetical protein FGSG_03798 [Fusarium graminearum PH-1]|eukprot:XP_011321889.1 hypothetical protein FGSG_03798 [Fusarium graminearum PH-1]
MNKNVAFIVSQISDIHFTTTERDVLIRFLVFSSRLAAWLLSQKNASPSTVHRWQLLMRQLSLTAKLLRVGKFTQQFRFAARSLTGRHQDLFLGIGFVPWKGAKTLERRAFRVWFAAGVCGLVAQVYCLYQLKTSDTSDQGQGDRQSLFRKTASKLQLVSSLCDITVSSAAAGLVQWDEGVVCASGMLSSLIAIYTQCKPSLKR